MTNFYRITLSTVMVCAFLFCPSCKRTDELSPSSAQQAASANKPSDPSSANKPAEQPSASVDPAKASNDPKQEDKAEQAPAAPEVKAELAAREVTSTNKTKTKSDTVQTASSEKKAADEQPPTKSTAGGSVAIPRSEHVSADIPAGLQKLLNNDSRMQPWVNTVMKVADSCYATQRESSESAAGVITIEVTMHPNARPDAEIKSLPPQLSGMVACATGGLMHARMPLFTGPEGEHYTIRIQFKR